jgi:hypothetical protein
MLSGLTSAVRFKCGVEACSRPSQLSGDVLQLVCGESSRVFRECAAREVRHNRKVDKRLTKRLFEGDPRKREK